MQLVKFRVENFRSVKNSGWIDADDITALVGVNESGKTNLLLPLWKLNPTSGGDISPIKDMPTSQYAQMRHTPENIVFITAVFSLSDYDRSTLNNFGEFWKKLKQFTVYRNFAGQYGITIVDQNGKSIRASDIFEIEPDETIDENTKNNEKSSLFSYLYKIMPKFVYYSNYGNLDAEINIGDVIQNLKDYNSSNKASMKARTAQVLFDYCGLDINEINNSSKEIATVVTVNMHGQKSVESETEQKKEKMQLLSSERQTLINSASANLTIGFREWWKQGDYTFSFSLDANIFKIWVSDKIRPTPVELENRSTGLQWFFSFFLIFTYEKDNIHNSAIILLDEPGLSLHPHAQRDLSAFFEHLSKTNQLLYSTHSPFLIDGDHLDKVRKVYVDSDGNTVATSNLGSGRVGTSDGAAYAVHSALNLSIAESLLLGCLPVIVEGPSDQHYLTAMKAILIKKGLINPPAELVFPSGGGAKTIKFIAGILLGKNDLPPVILLDDDTSGRQASESLRGELYSGSPNRIFSTGQFFDKFSGSEIEDLVPPQFIISSIDVMYRPTDEDGQLFSEFYSLGKPIIPQIKNWASSEKITLSPDWKPALAKRVKNLIRNKVDTAELPECWIIRWSKLFVAMIEASKAV